jgi:hypothetical protein
MCTIQLQIGPIKGVYIVGVVDKYFGTCDNILREDENAI